jgi:Helix-loop-helix DNA-binding domain
LLESQPPKLEPDLFSSGNKMQSTRVLHDPHSTALSQPPPFSFHELDDYHNTAFDFQSPTTNFEPFPQLPPPPSADFDLSFFSGNEQDEMLDFLRDLDTADPWEFNPMLPSRMPAYPGDTVPGESAHRTHHHPDHDHGGYGDASSVASVHSSTGTIKPDSQTTPQAHHRHSPPSMGNSYHHQNSSTTPQPQSSTSQSQAEFRPKPLLSAPQKRMNHVKSEKRRRDTIRDGYLTLTKILSPSGPGAEQIAIPRRGRPKGSGRTGTGKKSGKGKSGVLFRAVEYIRFMEQACDQLERECERLEKMSAGNNTTMGGQSYPNVAYGHSW